MTLATNNIPELSHFKQKQEKLSQKTFQVRKMFKNKIMSQKNVDPVGMVGWGWCGERCTVAHLNANDPIKHLFQNVIWRGELQNLGFLGFSGKT